MNGFNARLSCLALAGLLAACGSTRTETTVMDFSHYSGAYVLVYSADAALRNRFEDRLVSDLAARRIEASPSHADLPDIATADRDGVLAAARAHRRMFVLVVEEVGHDEIGVVPGEGRITHDHPTLLEFYEHSWPADHAHDDDVQVFVEVSAFLIEDDHGKLVWSGAAWSFEADGEAERISGLSKIIADAIEDARRAYLGPDA